MAIDVTGSKRTFGQLAQELNVNKFGILTQFPGEDPEFGYINEMEEPGRFGWSAGYGEVEPQLPYFPEQTGETPQTVQSLMITQNGKIVGKILKVLAYDD